MWLVEYQGKYGQWIEKLFGEESAAKFFYNKVLGQGACAELMAI